MFDGSISHPVPRRHAYLFGYFINTIDGTPLVASSDDQIAVHYVNQIRLPLSLHLAHVNLLLLHQLVDNPAFAYGTNKDGRLKVLSLVW